MNEKIYYKTHSGGDATQPQKFLDYEGVKHLWSKISMEDYPNNETLMAVINAIDETKADKSEITWANLPDKPFEGYVTSEVITIDDMEFIEELYAYYSPTILPFISTNIYHVVINNIQYNLSTFEFQGITCIGSTLGPCVIMPADALLSQSGILFMAMSEEPIQSFSISYSDIASVKKIPSEVLPNVNWSNNKDDQGYLLYEKIKEINIPFTIKDEYGSINFSPMIDNISNIISVSLKGENRNLSFMHWEESSYDSSINNFDSKTFRVMDNDQIVKGYLRFADGYGQLTSNVSNILTNFTHIELKYFSAKAIDYKFFQQPIFIEEDLQNFVALDDYEENVIITSALKHNTKVYGNYKNQLAEIDYYSFSLDGGYPVWDLYFHLIETNQYFINKFDHYFDGEVFNKIIEITPKLDLPKIATDDDVLDLLIETNIIEPIYSNNNKIFTDSEVNIFCL